MRLARIVLLLTAFVLGLPLASGLATEPNREGLLGRVIDAITKRPIPHLTVQMRRGKTVIATTQTTVDGSFSLSRPERKGHRVEVITDDWRITPRMIRLDEDQTSGAIELLFLAERVHRAPFHGRLLDARTGDPVPHYLFKVRGPRREERTATIDGDLHSGGASLTIEFRDPPLREESIITGPDGTFQSEAGFEAGLLDLVLIDHPDFQAEGNVPGPAAGTLLAFGEHVLEHNHVFDEAHVSPAAKIPIALGPTYRLQIALPEGADVSDFHATFPEPTTGVRELHPHVANAPNSPMAFFLGGATDPKASGRHPPLRGGKAPWVRFPLPLIPMGEVTEGRVLHVRSKSGYHAGSAPAPSTPGIHSVAVPIRLTHRGVIQGSVTNPEGRPVPTAWVQLFAPGTSEPLREIGADPEGRFDFAWLEEGDYEIAVETTRYESLRRSLSVKALETRELVLLLQPTAELGNVSGVMRSRTGEHRSKGVMVTLQSLRDPETHFFQIAPYRRRKGEYTAAFSFEDIPKGTYELAIDPLDNLHWPTRKLTLSPPAEDIVFYCEDDMPTFDLECLAIDAVTGEIIEPSWHILWQGDARNDVRLDKDWESGLYKGVPEGIGLRWVLRAEGYRLGTGDETVIRTEADRRVIEAKLERGWGQLFLVTTPERKPIAGVRLFSDGKLVSTSDARGILTIDLAVKPNTLDFRYRDWIVTWGTIDPKARAFGHGNETPVYMVPP